MVLMRDGHDQTSAAVVVRGWSGRCPTRGKRVATDARYHVCLAVRQGVGPSQRPRTLYLKFLNWPCFTKHPLGPDPDPFHCYCKHLGGKVSAMQMQPHLPSPANPPCEYAVVTILPRYIYRHWMVVVFCCYYYVMAEPAPPSGEATN